MLKRLAAVVFVMAALRLPALADTCTTMPWNGLSGVPALTDFTQNDLYLGRYAGLLYPGSNDVPSDHDVDGRVYAGNVQPRDASGAICASAGPGCKIVFLSVGFSNNTIEFCGGQGIGGDPDDPSATPCPLPTAPTPWLQAESFLYRALHDPAVNHTSVVLVDGAKGGQTLADWDPTVSGTMEYDRVRDEILTPSGLTEAQVQSIWVKDADASPTVSLATGTPSNPSDAVLAERHLGNIVREIRARYPSVQQVFISPRIYAGYANTANPPNRLNPEPYGFELGFSIKWLIESQIDQIRGSAPAPDAGDLDYRNGTAPWLAWGPYLWANGTTPRSDGLVWLNIDLRGAGNECTHPSTYGEAKVSAMLLSFLKTAPYTAWFLATGTACVITPGSLRLGSDKQTVSWGSNIATGPFDVVKGDLGTLRGSASFASVNSCRNNLTMTSTIDSGTPLPGTGALYLVRCDGGTWDDGTQRGDRDATLTACP